MEAGARNGIEYLQQRTALPDQLPDLDTIDRLLAERRLKEFIVQAWPIVEPKTPFVDNWHIDAICDHLEATLRGEILRLIINIPPRHMKSLIVSVFFPGWVWARQPDKRFLISSYAQDLSTRDSLKTRRLISSRWYQHHWGRDFWLSPDQSAKTRFENNHTGYRISTSIGGLGTGEGGDYIIVDDPHNTKEGESDAKRSEVLLWWDESMSTRVNDPRTGVFIIIMQRVHDRDLTGHVLEQEAGYTHLCIPSRYEGNRIRYPSHVNPLWVDPRQQPGELLWPGRYPEAAVVDLERRLGPYGTASQLQQRPSPRGGGFFKRHWFEVVDSVPCDFKRQLRFWDMAATKRLRKSDDPDYTVGTLMGDGVDGYLYVVDVVRVRDDPPVVEKTVGVTAQLDGRLVQIYMEQEPGSAGKSQISHYSRNVLRGYPFRGVRSTGNKEHYADIFASAAEQGLVRVVRGAWLAEWLAEHEMFPRGAKDDQVDSASKACYQLTGRPAAGVWGGRGVTSSGNKPGVGVARNQPPPPTVPPRPAGARLRLI